ncbi:hypothetical protein [Pseudomonas frederiksbergensis]|uniref:hypothetical protein n=1 Tax=Pseudomonas frederiksbergensis TaxID=104087 RepID=UPI000F48169E|nr:hypothetical protein [Pseudomonas frederiksbergensis]RON43015.1 hypothetical protein BK667_29670 [Pseudomonas frederiksbergensis]
MKWFMYGLALALVAPSAQAFNQEIRARFSPDPAQPQKNVFINQTPNSGYCATYPEECRVNETFSIRAPINFGPRGPIFATTGVSIRVPAYWRQVTVTNRDTLHTETVEVRISGIGSRYRLSDTAANLAGVTDDREGHQKLWGGQSWVYAPTNCLYSGVGAYSADSYQFFWKTPSEGNCTKVTSFRIPSMSFESLDFAYELRTPNPLGMSGGLYTGSLNYVLNPGADFNIGNMQPTDSNLTLDFVLDVQHTLKVDLPPGGNQVILEPLGGWQGWLDRGSKPTALLRDQTFLISASSRFTMKLECEWELVNGCAIIDRQTGIGGVVNVSVSLPHGLVNSSGQPVSHLPLNRTVSAPFQPGFYVDRKPGTLHFEMSEHSTSQVVGASAGRPFKGNITVVWDSQV